MSAGARGADGLDRLQRWMQAVLSHPDGVRAGAAAAEEPAGIDEVVAPSPSLSPEECIGIYSRMYFDRLVEVMESEFPAVRDAVGAAAFRRLARGYVVARPPAHYSLSRLGARFAGFLAEGARDVERRPFLVELARLERSVQDVFDAPRSEPLTAEAIQRVPEGAWATARIDPVPALRLLAFEHATNDWYQAFRDGAPRPPIERRPSWLVLYRREHRVWRLGVSREQHAILGALVRGVPLAAALEEAAALPGADPEALAASVGAWFRDWTGLGFFARIV